MAARPEQAHLRSRGFRAGARLHWRKSLFGKPASHRPGDFGISTAAFRVSTGDFGISTAAFRLSTGLQRIVVGRADRL